jgi:hypothetical protein
MHRTNQQRQLAKPAKSHNVPPNTNARAKPYNSKCILLLCSCVVDIEKLKPKKMAQQRQNTKKLRYAWRAWHARIGSRPNHALLRLHPGPNIISKSTCRVCKELPGSASPICITGSPGGHMHRPVVGDHDHTL